MEVVSTEPHVMQHFRVYSLTKVFPSTCLEGALLLLYCGSAIVPALRQLVKPSQYTRPKGGFMYNDGSPVVEFVSYRTHLYAPSSSVVIQRLFNFPPAMKVLYDGANAKALQLGFRQDTVSCHSFKLRQNTKCANLIAFYNFEYLQAIKMLWHRILINLLNLILFLLTIFKSA